MNPALRTLQSMAAGGNFRGQGRMSSTRPLSILPTGNVVFKRCQWIAGLPGPTDECKCLAPVVKDSKKNPHRAPYCAEHLAIAYPEGQAA